MRWGILLLLILALFLAGCQSNVCKSGKIDFDKFVKDPFSFEDEIVPVIAHVDDVHWAGTVAASQTGSSNPCQRPVRESLDSSPLHAKRSVARPAQVLQVPAGPILPALYIWPPLIRQAPIPQGLRFPHLLPVSTADNL